MAGIAVSDTYDALLSTTLRNSTGVLEDQITTSNKFFYFVKRAGNYKVVDNLGFQVQVPLMYQLTPVDSFAGSDTIPVAATDGVTVSNWDWRSAGTYVMITGEEEAKNRSESQVIDLLSSKIEQSKAGITQFFNQAFLQGNGINSATAVKTAYTSTANGSVFIDPICKLIDVAPTTGTVGAINSATYSWWRNQQTSDGSSTYNGFLQNLRNLYNKCAKGVDGMPDVHLVDQNVFEYYERALARDQRTQGWQKADIPFDSLQFKGHAVVWDEYVVDAANSTTASIPVATSGTWYMLTSRYIDIRVDRGANFSSTPFQKPYNQDAKSSLILWRGVSALKNRRKHGVLHSIDTTPTS